MNFVPHKLFTPAHLCSAAASNKLAFPAQVLQRIRFTPSAQFELSTLPPLSIPELSEWRLTTISEWRSTCHTSLATSDGKLPQALCHCPASHICGPYLVVELTRTRCGCQQSLQIRANAYNEQFLFLDRVPCDSLSSSHMKEQPDYGEDAASSGDDRTLPRTDDDNDVDVDACHRPKESTSRRPTCSVASQYANLSLPSSPQSKDLLKDFFFILTFSRPFSLADLAFLLSAIRQVHADNRWTEAYADRSLIDFTITEAAPFIRCYATEDWKSQVWQSYRKDISKLFYDRRIDAWNWWLSDPKSSIASQSLSSLSSYSKLRQQIREEREDLDCQRRLLVCMKERDSFLKVELNLLWTSTAAHQCAARAAVLFLQKKELDYL